MANVRAGIDDFRRQLPSAIVRDIESWRDHPELGPLCAGLHAHSSSGSGSDRHTFLNVYAEALVARHLLAHGCRLRFEVPTPTGRRADFEVTRGDARFFLHVKRLNTQSPARTRLTVSSRLRILEQIKRPYIVSVRWREGLTDRQMQQLVTKAAQFIEHARVGDELLVNDDRLNEEIGGVRIMAPGEGSHVTVVIGLPSSRGGAGGFVDEAPRMRKLLRKAYLQFMPKAPNVILMGTSHERDVADFETALLGSHIERWDTAPPKGQRIAHGRAEDGFWCGQRYELSRAAAWFRFSLKETKLASRLWWRNGESPHSEAAPLANLLQELFADN